MKKRYFITFASLVFLLTLVSTGCNQSHPGNWDEDTVESKLKEKMSLQSLELSPATGGFSGNGTDADGQTYEVTVTQNEATKELKYVAEGNRGAIEEGSIAFE
jgi:hypothetical protein